LAAEHPEDALARLFAEPGRFDFYQAVKVLEGYAQHARQASGKVAAMSVGSGADPADEVVDFRSTVSLAFPAADLDAVELKGRHGHPLVSVNFLGLAGARGPLPHFVADLVHERDRLGDGGLRDFLDLFNHRLVSLLFRVRHLHRPSLSPVGAHEHPYARYLLAFAGLADPLVRAALEQAKDPDDEPLRARDLMIYAGLFWHRDRSLDGLTRLLSHFLGVAVRGEPMRPRWLRLPVDGMTRLGRAGAHNTLGRTAVLGSRVQDASTGLDLEMGPLNWAQLLAFLPCGTRYRTLRTLARLYTRGAFAVQLRLTVDPAEVLPGRAVLGRGLRLGWTSWLVTRPLKAAEAKVCIDMEAFP